MSEAEAGVNAGPSKPLLPWACEDQKSHRDFPSKGLGLRLKRGAKPLSRPAGEEGPAAVRPWEVRVLIPHISPRILQ